MQWLEIFNHSPAAALLTVDTVVFTVRSNTIRLNSHQLLCWTISQVHWWEMRFIAADAGVVLMIHHLHDKARFMLSTLSTILAHAPAQFLHSVCARNYTGLIWMTVVVVVVYAVVNIIINILTPVFILHSLKVQHLKVVKNRIFVKIRIT